MLQQRFIAYDINDAISPNEEMILIVSKQHESRPPNPKNKVYCQFIDQYDQGNHCIKIAFACILNPS